MLGLIKKYFFTGLVFLSTLTSVYSLRCISMNNQACKVRPQIVKVNGDDHVFFPITFKTNKCNGSCNNINNPCPKLCVPDVVPANDKCRCECKEWVDKGVCDERFIWNPSNCKCECYKSCDFSEYLHYKNCKCKKRLVDKLVERSSAEECTESIEETRLVEITSAKNENKHKYSSCTLYIVLFPILFTVNVGIGSYFLYFHWYLKKICYSC